MNLPQKNIHSLPFDQGLVILPTYNEIENVEKMILRLEKLYAGLSILVVDDNSPDGTAECVERLQNRNQRLHLMKRSAKRGLGKAYIAGMKWALQGPYQYIFEMDCDFSHDPAQLEDLLATATATATEGADLVIGSRYIGGIRIINWPFRRLLLSYLASIYIRIVTGIPIKDATGGFKCFHRRALLAIDLDKILSNGYSFQLELNYKVWSKGLKVKEVPIVFYERRDGQSKMNKRIIIEALFAVFRLRLQKLFGTL